jgi:hypothetical protein
MVTRGASSPVVVSERFPGRSCRRYRIGGVTVRVESDLAVTKETFAPKLRLFEVDEPGEDTVTLHHHFGLPDLPSGATEVLRCRPWTVYRGEGSWIYVQHRSAAPGADRELVGVFDDRHTSGRIYHGTEQVFHRGGAGSLTLFPSDMLVLAPVLADRGGVYLHSCGIELDGRGYLFAGPSGAGKSTLARALRGRATVLCDEAVILRRWPEGFRIHGTWSHGELADVSPSSAPLDAVFFLERGERSQIEPLREARKAAAAFLSCLMKPLMTRDWWARVLPLVDAAVREVPRYTLRFDDREGVAELLESVQRPWAAGNG